MNKEEIREKILRYETHLNETLRNDLKTCLGKEKIGYCTVLSAIV